MKWIKVLNKSLGSARETKCTVGYKMVALVISFQRSLSVFLWWIKTWAKVCCNGNKCKAHCTLSLEESNHQMIKKLTQHLEHLFSPKKTCKLLGGLEGKYKWLRFEGRENKMFCKFCREFMKRKNLQYSRGSYQIISKQTAWKHMHVSWGQKDMLWPMFKNMEFLFLTQHITCILYI